MLNIRFQNTLYYFAKENVKFLNLLTVYLFLIIIISAIILEYRILLYDPI